MNFLTALQNAKQSNKNIVIADIKCYSPKEGDLLRGRKPSEIAKALIEAGAPVLSVVTEAENFHGSKEMLGEIASLGVPVLRKDFLKTKADIHETKALGASAVLLMYSCLDDKTLLELYLEAKSIGLDVLVETHNLNELRKAASIGAKLIGINNREIRNFEKDNGTVTLTEQLAIHKPDGAFLVSESAMMSPEDVRRGINAGADAVLVGTALLHAENTQGFYQKMCRKIRVKLCGMMSEENMNKCRQADILGFVVDYPEDVPWNISIEKAKELIVQVPDDCKSCVVTGGSYEKVIEIASLLQPDYIQLHHKESLEQTRQIADELRKTGVRVIRSIPSDVNQCIEQFGTSDLSSLSKLIAQAGVAEILIDCRNAEHAAGCANKAPISFFRELNATSPIPVMLAGGLTPQNIHSILSASGANKIDLMTGIESAPGIKNECAVNKLFELMGG